MPSPRLAPAPETFPADDIALVRPYYVARERERDLSRVQAEATIRLRAWTHGSVHVPAPAPPPVPVAVPAPAPVPVGDLLAAAPARYADGVTV